MATGIVSSHCLATSHPCIVWHHAIERPGVVVVPWEWPAVQCYTVAALLSPVSTSCWYLMCHPYHAPRAIMTLSAHTSDMYLSNVRVHLVNVRVFFYLLLMAHRRSQYVCFPGAPVRRATGSRAPCHVVAPELTYWARSCGTRGGSRTSPPGAERRGSRVADHVAVPEPSHFGSRDLELRDSWRRVDARPAQVLTWSLYAGVPGLQDIDICFLSKHVPFLAFHKAQHTSAKPSIQNFSPPGKAFLIQHQNCSQDRGLCRS
jgi:hypothetical protein